MTVGNANEGVTIISGGGAAAAALAVAENGLAVTTVAATDLDGTAPAYAIVGGADADLFTIDAVTGALSFVSAPDFEGPGDADGDNVYDVVVAASDGSLSDSQALAVTVGNANEGVTIVSAGGGDSASVSVVENGEAVAIVAATDADGTAPFYAISGGADAALFAIDAVTGALSFVSPPDFEAPGDADGDNVYDVIVSASDGSFADNQALAVTVGNANEGVTINSDGGGAAAALTVAENNLAVTVVAANDLDGTAPSYAIAGGADAGRFTIDAATGALAFVSAPDFEAPADADGDNVYELIVSASDGSVSDTQALAVTVGNINDVAPVIGVWTEDTIAIALPEGNMALVDVDATDGDGDELAYSLAGADAALFAIDFETGAISFLGVPDYEAPGSTAGSNVYSLTVIASDGLLSDTLGIIVTIANVNEAIAIVSGNSYSLAENGTAVGQVMAVDQDGTAPVFSIAGGADAARFAIDAATGALSFLAAPDFEAPGDAGGDNVYDVIVAASDGQYSDTRALAVSVTNANEGVTITSNSGAEIAGLSIAENGLAVDTVTAVDADGDAVTYSISGGADAALFAIDPLTGALRFLAAPNVEAPGDAGGDNVYNVIVAASDGTYGDEQMLAVQVTNVNEGVAITSGGGGSSATVSVAENGLAVTNVAAVDADGTPVSYAIVGGADAARFTIDAATGALSFISAANFEAPADAGADNVYDVVVAASDGLLSDTQALAVTVTNVNEGVTITSGGGGSSAAVSVAENGLAVANVAAVDADGTPVTYSIAGGADAARFTIDAATGALSFIAAANFEAPADAGGNNVYDVVVAAGDGVFTDTQALAVSVTNVNEGVTINSGGGGASASVSVAENGLAVTSVAATDADGAPVVYAIAGGADAARFTIDAATGALRFVAAPNHEAPADAGANNVYDVIVSASDGIFTDTQSIAVTVTNVLEGNTIVGTSGNNSISTTTSPSGQPRATELEDVISGLGGADTIASAGGGDIVDGGAGNDQITGGLGADILTGGTGADRFIYNAASESGVGAGARDFDHRFQPRRRRQDLAQRDRRQHQCRRQPEFRVHRHRRLLRRRRPAPLPAGRRQDLCQRRRQRRCHRRLPDRAQPACGPDRDGFHIVKMMLIEDGELLLCSGKLNR